MDQENIKQIEFQMQSNDLHAQVATLLELVREDIIFKGWTERHDKIIKSVIEDLMFVHNGYEASFKSRKGAN